MPFSLSDILAGYGGSPDPENPSSGEITPGLLLRAFGHVAAPGLVDAPVFDPNRIGPQGSAFTPALTARDYATALSAGKNKPPDPLETMLGVGGASGGSPAMFVAGARLNPELAASAEQMFGRGLTRDTIFRRTGMTRGTEGALKGEISDLETGFTPAGLRAMDDPSGPTLPLTEAYHHPELYKLHPELADYKVVFRDPMAGTLNAGRAPGGTDTERKLIYLDPSRNPTELRSIMLHELQHPVQSESGFALGGSPMHPDIRAITLEDRLARAQNYQRQIDALHAQRDAYIDSQVKAGRTESPTLIAQEFWKANPEMTQESARLHIKMDQLEKGVGRMDENVGNYRKLAGETEARNVQTRRYMGPEEIAKTPPWKTEDIPRAEQLLRLTETGPLTRYGAMDLNYEAPSFSERMGTAQDVAFAGRQRGTGNILPRSTAQEAPLLAPGETRGDLVGALTPGLPPAETSIADIGRNAYRGFEPPPGPPSIAEIGQRTYAERLGLDPRRLQMSAELPKPTTEMTPIGEQYVLPGAEQRTSAQMAQRAAEAPLKPKVQQKAADEGLFGAQARQGNLQLSAELPAGAPSGTSTFRAANVDRPPVAPSLISRANPTPADVRAIYNKLAETGRGDVWPPAQNPVFKTTPEAYAETQALVPQRSIAGELPQLPDPSGQLPLNDRARTLMTLAEPTAASIAERLSPMVRSQSPLLDFYQTGPVVRGLAEHAVGDVPAANQFMREWSGQGAATSPRTQTPPNLRNASHLLYQRAQGNPITPDVWEAQGNVKGLPMMRMHVDLADKFATGTANPLKNPKPFTFRENWAGNQLDPTIDTHNIRSVLYMIDQQRPGSLPREWFTSDRAYYNYKEGGGFNSGKIQPGDINDELAVKAVNKVESQVEYPIVQQPWRRAAEMLGITPAQAQSGGWFEFGPITGLKSPPQTIPDLLNNQIEATAKVLNVPPQKVLEWWGQGKIPLAGIAGGVSLGNVLLGQSQDRQ
jgi:hypothetical protein